MPRNGDKCNRIHAMYRCLPLHDLWKIRFRILVFQCKFIYEHLLISFIGVIGGWSPQSVPFRGELKFCETSLASDPKSVDGWSSFTTPLWIIIVEFFFRNYVQISERFRVS